jgi:integrase
MIMQTLQKAAGAGQGDQGHTTPEHTVADLLEAYTRDFLPMKAPTTQYHERVLFRWFAHNLGTIPLQNLSPLILRSWRDSLQPYYHPGSIRRYMTALSAVLTAGVEHYGWLTIHPLRKVLRPPTQDRERFLEAEEQARLLAACQQSRNQQLYLVVVLALATGARKNEILQRTWSDLDLERGLLRLPRSKNGDRRAVPLMGQALVLLRQQAQSPAHSRWVFPRADGRQPVRIDYAWRQACLQAGIVDLHFHDLRHTAASNLAMSGASLRDIAEILGHRSLRQTMKYAHLLEPHTRGVLERMIQKHLAWPLGAEARAEAIVAEQGRAYAHTAGQ